MARKKTAPAPETVVAPKPSLPNRVAAMVECTPETLAAIEPGAVYQVRMARAVKYGRTWLRPNAARARLSGTALVAVGDAVKCFAKVV